jgi:hypothetical protein
MRDFSTVILGEPDLAAVILSSVTKIITAPGEQLLRNLEFLILAARWWVVQVTSIIHINILAFVPTCWWAT